MKIGDRVLADRFPGILVEPTEEMLSKRENIRNRAQEFWWIRYDGVGPFGDGIGAFHRTSFKIFKLSMGK